MKNENQVKMICKKISYKNRSDYLTPMCRMENQRFVELFYKKWFD